MPKTTSAKLSGLCNWKLCIGGAGFLLALFGLLCGLFWADLFTYGMGKEIALRPNSRVYESWKVPPLDLNLDIYFFNWTNPDDFRNLSTKPILQQLGPYRFKEKPDKVDIVWHPENYTVSYRKKSDFYFDAENSNGSLDDEITILNAVALSASATAKHWDILKRNMVDISLKIYNQPMAITKTADEFLFTGYQDDMIDVARAAPIFGDEVQVPFDRFGWFYTRNGSADLTGTFNVHTGVDDIYKIGQMHSWNFKTHTGFSDSYCGMVNGSAGEFFPPNLKKGGSISLFTPDMCRSVPLDYEETVQVEGITGFKFSGGLRSVDNGTLYPENKCFCGGECVPSGVMNVSACRFGSPVFMSYPHFFNADPLFVNQVEGLKPNKNDHEFYMTLEPNTGVALEVAARFQVNMLVEPIEHMSFYEDVPRTFFPLIWFEQKVRISPEFADELKTVPRILTIGHIVAGVTFAIGIILICWHPAGYLIAKLRGDLKPSLNKPKATSKVAPTPEFSASYKKAMEAEGQPEGSPLLTKPYLTNVKIISNNQPAFESPSEYKS